MSNDTCWCGRPYPCLDHFTSRSRRARLRALAVALAAVAGLVVAGCDSDPGPHGTVTGKEHEAAQTTWRTVAKTKRVCTTTTRRTGKTTSRSQSCRTVPNGSRLVADVKPECWELDLDTGDEVCVSEDLWRRTAVGDEYPDR